MIVFSGTLSKNTERFIIREHKKIDAFVWISVGLIFGIPLAIFSITVEPKAAWFMIVIAYLFISPIIPYAKYEKKGILPQKIWIDLKEETVVFKNSKHESFHMISDIEKIEDWGEWYYFRFSAGDRSFKFVCQKNLTSPNELAEFEKEFESLIVKV